MANLGWTPIQMEPAGPPWGWNPAATFMTAFYTAQENKIAQEKAARERDMEQILFPLKAQQTALELDKLQMEVERGAMTNQIYRKALRQSHSGQMEGLRDIDRNVSGGGQANAGGGRYGGRVADIVKSYQGGAAVPSAGGGGGGKILGTGLNP